MLLPTIVLAGFVAAAVTPLLHARLGRAVIVLVVAVPAAIAAALVAQAPAVLDGATVRGSLTWVPQLGLGASFALDGLSLLFALLISGIGVPVFLYADRYLASSPLIGRFHGLMLAFMAAMLGLVLADDLLMVVVFWGLTGVTSFLLIGFDHEAGVARRSAQQALVVTAAGELAMLAGFVLLGVSGGSFRLSELPAAAAVVQADPVYPLLLVLVLAGALSKSAQFPFHFWLPNAMAAPTPVSAYLHSATMVTAGVYLLARLASTLGGTEAWAILVAGSGALTMLIGSLLSLRHRDLKLVLAYSTVAALGTMVLLLGIGGPAAAAAAMALLLAHALYKGGLFLVTGILDHEAGTRELDRLGGLARALPLTALAAGLAALSMAGLPPLVGFAAKELSLKATLDAGSLGLLLAVALVVSAMATVAVAGIATVGPFLGVRRSATERPHEAPAAMWLAPLALGALGIAAGLAPALGSGPLVASAATVIATSVPKDGVAPWYGVDAILLLSLVSLIVGAAIVLGRRRVRAVVAGLDIGWRIGPERGYVVLERALLATAKGITRWLQDGRLRRYLLVVIGTLVVFGWAALLAAGGVVIPAPEADLSLWGLLIGGLIVGGAAVAVTSGSRLGAVTALALVGYGIALIYVRFSAPDLAMAQILVETLTVLLFVLVFYHLPPFGSETARASRWRDALIALGGGSLLTVLIIAAATTPTAPISSFFLDVSASLAKGRNVVNTILVDFRALDTLAEVAVLAIAGFGVFGLLKLRSRGRSEDES